MINLSTLISSMLNKNAIYFLKFLVIFMSVFIALAEIPVDADIQEIDETVRLVMLPFDISADSNASYLANQIPEVIGTHLKRSGAIIISPSDAEALGTTMNPDVRSFARSRGATHIISGKFSIKGAGFALEASLWNVDEGIPPSEFKANGRNLEELLSVIKSLSDEIGQKLFSQRIIADIQIKGNQRIESDAILRLMQSKIGGTYKPNQLSEDLHAIYNMGYFDDLKVESQSGPEGRIIIFHVKEKPTIRRIKFSGNQHYNDDKLKENLTISTGSILNIFKIRSNINVITDLYKEDNYHRAKVEFKIHPLENNQADLEFVIDEGSKLYITNITFIGNHAFTDKQLLKQISTSPKGFFYWISSSGDLDRAVLDQDVGRLNAYYHNQGYIQARIGEPQIDILEDEIHVTIKVEEGSQFNVGKVDISGDLIFPKEELLKDLTIDDVEHYSREKLQNDVIALTDAYAAEGYAYADVMPQISEDKDNLVVDITYRIKKGELVYFEKIIISGNTNTRDKVIRRELKVHEQEQFNGTALKRSVRNLYRLDYFGDIKVQTLKGSAEDQMVLKIDVAEKSTGTFSFGAGYSSEENFFLLGSVSIRNFLGRGQTLQFNGQLGGSTTRYTLSFTEPWLFDTRLSATAQLYDQKKEYENEYNLDSLGGGLSFGYPIFDYTRLHFGYSYDLSEVTEVTDAASDQIRELEGINATSRVHAGLTYDSRFPVLQTNEGSKHSLTLWHAGLGGDIGFNKAVLETGWYIPLFKGFVGFIHGKAGVVKETADDKLLPDYEKFYLGGINSMRGYEWRGIHLTEINENGELSKVGGEMMAQFNFELLIPIYQKMGIRGVVFYDMGNVYDDNIDLGNLRSSWGYGIRWNSPLAPIRIEYGNVIDPREGEEDGRLEFTLGGAF